MHNDLDDRPSTLPVDIILFCDEDSSLFKAIVQHYSLEVDGMIAEELGYLNLHHRRRVECGLDVSYLEFDFFSHAEGRFYRVTRFDTLEDAARFLLSEPYDQRGAILVSTSSEDSGSCDSSDEPGSGTASMAKHLIRTTLGFACAAVIVDEASTFSDRDSMHEESTEEVMDFSENGMADKSLITRVECSTRSMLDAKQSYRPMSMAWWCPSPVRKLQSILTFFHSRLPLYNKADETCFQREQMRTRHLSKVLTARFYCFGENEGGAQITAMDQLKISIAGNMVAGGHIVDSPGLAIEPGKFCQDNVLIFMDKHVPADPRDQFVVRRMNGATVGVGMIVSCS